MLIPAAVAMVLFAWIAVVMAEFLGAESIQDAIVWVFCGIPVILLVVGFGVVFILSNGGMGVRIHQGFPVDMRDDIDSNWPDWEKRIQAELKRRDWVDITHIEERYNQKLWIGEK